MTPSSMSTAGWFVDVLDGERPADAAGEDAFLLVPVGGVDREDRRGSGRRSI
jgi:hypothetical protein